MTIDKPMFAIGKCCFHSKGSVVAHFWLILSIPESHAGKVTMQKVNESLLGTLQSFSETGVKDTVSLDGYLLFLSSFSISGNSRSMKLKTPEQTPLQCFFRSFIQMFRLLLQLRCQLLISCFVHFHLLYFCRIPAQSYRFFASLIWYDIFNSVFHHSVFFFTRLI